MTPAKCKRRDEEDEELLLSIGMMQVFHLLICLMASLIDVRAPPLPQQRLDWSDYVEKRNRDPEAFRRHLRMSYESFEKLLSYIRADVEVDHRMATLRGGPIMPEVCLFCTLRWLAGGTYLDIYDIAGISKTSFYRVVWKTIMAICTCEELQIKFPTTMYECTKAAEGFESTSEDGAIANCVGAIDGYLLRIRVPVKSEVGNVRSYFSGHYQCYGINIQAVCDHMCHFTYLAVAAPGSTGDNDACKECSLYHL